MRIFICSWQIQVSISLKYIKSLKIDFQGQNQCLLSIVLSVWVASGWSSLFVLVGPKGHALCWPFGNFAQKTAKGQQ